MNVQQCLSWAVDPALDWLHEHGLEPSEEARIFLLAVAAQECGWQARAQWPSGPGRGLWQFEPIAVKHVMLHPVTGPLAAAVLAEAMVKGGPARVWAALEHHDQLAAVFARLLVLPDPHPLPDTALSAWDTYLRVWRPGAPRSQAWAANYASACAAAAMRRWRAPPQAVPA